MNKYLCTAGIFVIVLLAGCCEKQPIPEPVIITKYKEVNVPVKCVVPPVTCDFSGTKYEPTVRLLECIVKLKRSIEVCQ